MDSFEIVTSGSCCKKFTVYHDRGIIDHVSHVGGCSGNLDAISILMHGMKLGDVSSKFRGLRCGMKPTSCMDQLSVGIEKYLSEKGGKRIMSSTELGNLLLTKVRDVLYGNDEYEVEDEDIKLIGRRIGKEKLEELMEAYFVDLCSEMGTNEEVTSVENFTCREVGEGKDLYGDNEPIKHVGFYEEHGVVAFIAGDDAGCPKFGFIYSNGSDIMTYIPRAGNPEKDYEGFDGYDFEKSLEEFLRVVEK